MAKHYKVPILKTIQKVEGGLLLAPMLVMSLFHTFFPQLFEIGAPTQTLFSAEATMVLVGLMLFFSGTQCTIHGLGGMLKRYGGQCIIKLFIAIGIGYFMMHTLGYAGWFGISTIAVIAVLTSCNPGLFLALMHTYGDETDRAAFGLLNLIVVPIVPITILNAVGGNGIDWLSIFSTIFPFLLGLLLGNMDQDIRVLFKPGTMLLLPFLGISFGARIDLLEAVQAGVQGIALTAVFYLVSFLPVFLYERIRKEVGYRACAMSSVAGLSLAVPVMLAQENKMLAGYTSAALSQIALAVVLTSFLTPILMKKLVR